MDKVDAAAILDRITYKPDTCIKWGFEGSGLWINITHTVLDITSKDEMPCVVGGRHGLDQLDLCGMEERHLIHWVRSQLERLAVHELDEWFKVDGIHVRDPHPEVTLAKKA